VNYYVIICKGDEVMPATITHAFFAVDVYNKLKNEKVLKAADLGRLKMFAQKKKLDNSNTNFILLKPKIFL